MWRTETGTARRETGVCGMWKFGEGAAARIDSVVSMLLRSWLGEELWAECYSCKGPRGWLNTSSAFLGSVFCLCIWLWCSEFNFPNWKKPVLKSDGWCRQMYSLREMSLRMTRNPVEVERGYSCVVDQAHKEGLECPSMLGPWSAQSLSIILWHRKFAFDLWSIRTQWVSKSWSLHQN